MTRNLPPIFAKARFQMPADMLPAVVFQMSREREAEADRIIAENDERDTRIEHFGRWWVECRDMAILATLTDETEHALTVWGRRSGRQAPFKFCDSDLSADAYHQRFTDWQKLAIAQYVRAALVLASYTEAQADVSVLTGTRKSPGAWERQGDSLRYVPVQSLRTLSGLHRVRDYARPDEPSGIRMREHDVRGHWRTYSTGIRVWVRAHKRGDAELGRVTRVIQ